MLGIEDSDTSMERKAAYGFFHYTQAVDFMSRLLLIKESCIAQPS